MLPIMEYTPAKGKKSVVAFRGLNLTSNVRDGDFVSTGNISTRDYPALAPRASRSEGEALASPQALFASGKLCYVSDSGFYYDGALKGAVSEGEKQFAVVNTKIVIWPDKKYYDTLADEFGDLGASYSGNVSITTDTSSSTMTCFSPVPFSEGDAVKVTGAGDEITAIIRVKTGNVLKFDKVFEAMTVNVTMTREIPEMEYICSSNNRLWGCGGSTIYGSALGDPKNFNIFDGTSEDSYAVAVGSDGEWTGCIDFSSHVFFSKENIVHKLYGTKPSNYSLTPGHIDGVMKGCHKSMLVIGDILYYWSRRGLLAYTGSVPSLLSNEFGETRFSNVIAGTDNERYYASMKMGEEWGLYVFDLQRGLWVREDDTHALDFAFLDGVLYYLDTSIVTVNSGNESVEWDCEFSPFHETSVNKKGFFSFAFRIWLGRGSTFTVSMNEGGRYKELTTVHAERDRVFNIPIRPTRCDALKLKLSGKGEFRLYQMVREVKERRL